MKVVSDTNYLHELDMAVKRVADRVMEAIREGNVGTVKIAGSNVDVMVPSKGISVSEMARLKRMYLLTLNKLDMRLDMDSVMTGFANHINQNLR